MMDLIFILDSSGSVNNIPYPSSPAPPSTNWGLETTFVQQAIRRVTLGITNFQIGVITFSNTATLNIPLGAYSSAAQLSNAVGALSYLGGGTNLRAALALARTQAFAPSNGGRPGAYR